MKVIIDGEEVEVGRGKNLAYTDLRGADLRGMYLLDVDLRGADVSDARINACIGDGVVIKNIPDLKWHTVYTRDVMAIGCEQHTIEQWMHFDDEEISSMHESALEFWRVNKAAIFRVILGEGNGI